MQRGKKEKVFGGNDLQKTEYRVKNINYYHGHDSLQIKTNNNNLRMIRVFGQLTVVEVINLNLLVVLFVTFKPDPLVCWQNDNVIK